MASFELLGNREKTVAIIETSGNKKKDKAFAKELLKKIKSIRSVLLKKSKRKGMLRKREYEVIAGSKNTEVIHKEHGFLLKLDPQETYFSPRELTERQKIANLIKKNERVLVMFSGIGPLICAIKKKEPSVEVYGIELNSKAHEYALENITMNKFNKINLIKGDVRKIIPSIKGKFNRILMPLPKTSHKFLDLAFQKIQRGGIIHYYTWTKEDQQERIKKVIQKEAEKCHKKIMILTISKVLPYAPKIYKMRVDIECLN